MRGRESTEEERERKAEEERERKQRKRGRELERTKIRVKHGSKYGEIILLGDYAFIIHDIDHEEKEISRARTFGFLKDVEKMRSSGLIKGGSLDNAVVVDDFRVVNEGGLRYKDEFVRHKILDAIGDISILGMPVIGHLKLHRPGHSLNHDLTKEVMASPESWKVVELNDENLGEALFKMPRFGLPTPAM